MPAPAIGVRPGFVPSPTAQVDWSHPLAQGLVFCTMPGAARRDLVSGVLASQAGTVVHGGSRWGPTAQAVTGSTPTNWLDFGTGGSLGGSTNGSWTWVGRYVAAGAATPLIARWGSSNGFLTYVAGGTTYNAAVVAGGVQTIATGPSAATGDEVVITCVKDGTSLRAWRNGTPGAAATCNAGTIASGDSLRMFNKTSDAGTAGTSGCALALVHARALSEAEIQMLAADPFCFLRY